MRILRARLFELEDAKRQAERAAERRTMVGSGDRSERIRTYNFPQNRITDHRIDLTLYKLELAMEGDIDELVDALVRAAREALMKAETQPSQAPPSGCARHDGEGCAAGRSGRPRGDGDAFPGRLPPPGRRPLHRHDQAPRRRARAGRGRRARALPRRPRLARPRRPRRLHPRPQGILGPRLRRRRARPCAPPRHRDSRRGGAEDRRRHSKGNRRTTKIHHGGTEKRGNLSPWRDSILARPRMLYGLRLRRDQRRPRAARMASFGLRFVRGGPRGRASQRGGPRSGGASGRVAVSGEATSWRRSRAASISSSPIRLTCPPPRPELSSSSAGPSRSWPSTAAKTDSTSSGLWRRKPIARSSREPRSSSRRTTRRPPGSPNCFARRA